VIRPAEYMVHASPVVILDGRTCVLIGRVLDLDRVRRDVRGQDAQLDQALVAIKLAGIAYTTESSSGGTVSAADAEPVARSRQHDTSDTVSTTTAAAALGITGRAVRKAITEKRLNATLLDGRYRITRDDLTAFREEDR
jgi:excisionase family DNA binding protein